MTQFSRDGDAMQHFAVIYTTIYIMTLTPLNPKNFYCKPQMFNANSKKVSEKPNFNCSFNAALQAVM